LTIICPNCETRDYFPPLFRTRGGEKLELHDDGITYTVWISFAEIYNENIYDLFQKVPEVGGRPVHPDSLNPAFQVNPDPGF
jgi:hypothetical protein